MSYSRFAIYYIPTDRALIDFGATWLGWDVVKGRKMAQLNVAGLRDITMTPMKYGFHGTLKPPFRLKTGTTVEQLVHATATLAAHLAPAVCDGLSLTTLGNFLALTPIGDVSQLQRVAQACVQDLDPFRALATSDELARRRKAGLSDRQDALLQQWGYPYVMEEFRFHLTLSGRLQPDEIAFWSGELHRRLPQLPTPFHLGQIALCGERDDGCFEVIHRYDLTG